MGFINLLKNGYRGKLGETVGQKWKDQLTVRTYQGTNNSKSPAQIDQRAHYKTLIQEASVRYPLFCTSERIQVKGMNKFNLFTQFWDKSDGGLNPIYPQCPYFKTEYPSNVYLLTKYTSSEIYFGVPYDGMNKIDGLESIGYTFLLNPNQRAAVNRPTQFFLDQISIKKAHWERTDNGWTFECFTIILPGVNINNPTGLRQIRATVNGKNRYSRVSNIADPIASRNNTYQVTLL